jgi:hypothetical protein
MQSHCTDESSSGQEWKRCTKCGERKALSEFARKKKSGDERMPRCNACRGEALKRWLEAHPENQAEYKAKERAKRAAARGHRVCGVCRRERVLAEWEDGQTQCKACQGLTKQVEYRDVPGWPGYQCGSDGTVWSRWLKGGGRREGKEFVRGRKMGEVWKPLQSSPAGPGYPTVNLCDGEKHQNFTLHTLILLTFVGPRPEGYDVRHLDGDKDNNALANLTWGTRQENCADTMRHGRTTRGEKSGTAKVTEDTVRTIRQMHRDGVTRQGIADHLGLSYHLVRDVVSRKTWKHLPD